MKNTSRTSIFVIASLVLCGFAGTASAQDRLNLRQSVDVANSLQLLTQRMGANYCYIGATRSEDASDRLSAAIELFEEQLRALQRSAPSDDIRSSLSGIESSWYPMKSLLTENSKTTDDGEDVVEAANDLMQQAEDVMLQLEDYLGGTTSQEIGLSERLRILTQRIAMLHVCREWGVDSARLSTGLRRAGSEANGTLNELESSPENNAGVRRQLNQAKITYSEIQYILEDEEGREAMENMMDQSERLMNIAAQLVSDYRELTE